MTKMFKLSPNEVRILEFLSGCVGFTSCKMLGRKYRSIMAKMAERGILEKSIRGMSYKMTVEGVIALQRVHRPVAITNRTKRLGFKMPDRQRGDVPDYGVSPVFQNATLKRDGSESPRRLMGR